VSLPGGFMRPNSMNERGAIAGTLDALIQRDVKFLVAGGVAAQLYGSRRLTMDLDIIPSLLAKDWAKLLRSLDELGFVPMGAEWAEIENVTRLHKWARPRDALSLRFRRAAPALDIDILIREGHRYPLLAEQAQRAVEGDLVMRIVGKADLIEMKRRANRPQDLQDIAAIEGK
jgi:hypothetical protein